MGRAEVLAIGSIMPLRICLGSAHAFIAFSSAEMATAIRTVVAAQNVETNRLGS